MKERIVLELELEQDIALQADITKVLKSHKIHPVQFDLIIDAVSASGIAAAVVTGQYAILDQEPIKDFD